MKSTEQFKGIIQDKLNEMAANDELFAKSLKKENKNINDCIKYILNTVKKSGCCGFSDDEVFGMAAHYYDEDDIKVGGDVKCKIVTNHTSESVELTEEEKKAAKQKAIDLEIEAQRAKLHKKKSKADENPKLIQKSLF